MRRGAVIAMTVLAVVLLAPTGPLPVGAGAVTDVYVVHGFNRAGQTEPGGTAVTVCADDELVAADLQFGDVIGPLSVPSDVDVDVDVYSGAGNDCAAPVGEVVLEQTVTPTGVAVSLVVTSFGEMIVPELVPIPLDVECVDPGNARLSAVHTANAPEVDVVNTDLGVSVGTLSFGEQITGQLPAAIYGIEVFVVDGAPEPVLAFDFDAVEGTLSVGYAVGGLPLGEPTPYVIVPQAIPVATCEPPATEPPTTATPTTASSAAAAATARPTFTG
jgi:hypothetical protein